MTTLVRPRTIPSGWTEAEWEALVEKLTRRDLISGALATMLLAACGSGDEATPEVARRDLVDAYGNVSIPVKPTRVVAVDPYSLFTMLDAGITPIATTSSDSFSVIGPEKDRETVAGLPSVGAFGAIDVEKIGALDPDLVIGLNTYLDETIYPQISAIVPVYALAFNRSLTWEQMDTEFASVANQTKAFDEAKQVFVKRRDAIARDHQETLRSNTWEFVLGKAENYYRLGTSSDWSNIAKQMGATLGNAGQVDFFGPLLSFERIDLLSDATVIVTSPRPGSDVLLAQPLLANMPATEAGHLYTAKNVNSYSGAGEFLDLMERICKQLEAGK